MKWLSSTFSPIFLSLRWISSLKKIYIYTFNYKSLSFDKNRGLTKIVLTCTRTYLSTILYVASLMILTCISEQKGPFSIVLERKICIEKTNVHIYVCIVYNVHVYKMRYAEESASETDFLINSNSGVSY